MNRTQLHYAGRLHNARFFFMHAPLQLLDEAQAIGIGLPRAFHCAGPTLGVAAVVPPGRPCVDRRLLDAYAQDYTTGESGHWTGD